MKSVHLSSLTAIKNIELIDLLVSYQRIYIRVTIIVY